MQTFASNSFHGTNIWENNSWEIEWVGGNNSLANNPWQENNIKAKVGMGMGYAVGYWCRHRSKGCSKAINK